ncbi:L,D-transpeptidase [Candidatus Halobeggiatoa sp. HSG11]|nr:L,D-transpeptidase [Candidatus Halobeggiatoa sp. HSG11]
MTTYLYVILITLMQISFANIQAMETDTNSTSNSSANQLLDTAIITVDISEQKLYLRKENNELVKTYDISTSKFGIGSKAYSNKTPLGWHHIENKIGADAPEGTIFKARQNTGKIAKINGEIGDLVTSRIMWLKGLDEGKNLGTGIDSYKRYIYIHGTAEENKIGKRASHGCIRMLNRDVIELFNLVKEKTKINIVMNQETIPSIEKPLE